MAFRRFAAWASLLAATASFPVFGVLAWQAGYYATAGALALAVSALAVLVLIRLLRPSIQPAPPPAAPDAGERSLLRTMLDQSPGVLLALGPDDVLRAANRAARRLFETDDRVVAPPETLLAAIRETPPGAPRSILLERKTGNRAYSLATSDVATAQGSTRLASLLDIQAELMVSEAAAMRETLEVVGHEIMNSLTPILSLSATAAALLEEPDAAAQAAAADAIATLARRAGGLARFVQGYRSLTRLPPQAPAPVDVDDLLGELARLFEAQWGTRGVTLALQRLGHEHRLTIDRDQVLQALLNLTSNAAQAALETPERPPRVLITASLAADLALAVADSGAGVPDGLAAAIFRPFLTTRAEGAGVGLSLARQIARSHGGDVTLRPRGPLPGAEFVLSLPSETPFQPSVSPTEGCRAAPGKP